MRVRGALLRVGLVFLASAVAGACGDDDSARPEDDASTQRLDASTDAAPDAAPRDASADASTLSCATANQMLYQLTNQTAAELSCSVDADCTMLTPRLRCGDAGTHLEFCPTAVSNAGLGSMTAEMRQLEGTVCSMLSLGCRSIPTCKPVLAQCVSQQCALVARE